MTIQESLLALVSQPSLTSNQTALMHGYGTVARQQRYWREYCCLQWIARLRTSLRTTQESLSFYLPYVPSLISHPNISSAQVHEHRWAAERYLPQNPALPLLLLEDPSLAQYLRET